MEIVMRLPLALLAMIALTAAGPVERPYSLMAGDPAPPLAVQSWVQGEPVTAFERGQVYVVDFWATWCGPCKESMPALSALQRELGDRVTIVGVDTWDYADRVAPFVQSMGDRLSYRIAIDRQPAPPEGEGNIPMFVKANGESSIGWLSASGWADEGIPAIFVIDGRGRVAWIGSEVDSLRAVLDQVLDGRWDLAGYSARYARDAVVLRQGRALQGTMFRARQRKEWPAALADGRKLLALDPRYHEIAGTMFRITYVNLGDRAGALAFADSQKTSNRNAGAFESMASVIASDTTSAADLGVAEGLAKHANQLAGGKSPGPFSVLARLAMRRGDRAAAVAHQTRALGLITDSEEKRAAEATLAEYQR
jgi:thiol-disulfide isomerase/thioredoxin